MSKKFQEFEVKFTIATSGVEDLRSKLRSLNSTQIKDVVQIDDYLDDETNSLSIRDHLLRLRKESNVDDIFQYGEFSWKGPRRGTQIEIREDLSIPFTTEKDVEAFRVVLNKLGYRRFIRFRKSRERWKLENDTHSIEFEFDKEVWSEDDAGNKFFLGRFCQAAIETDLEISDLKVTSILWKIIDSIDVFIFHYESEGDKEEIINLMKKYKKKVGIAINPNTPLQKIMPYLNNIDILNNITP